MTALQDQNRRDLIGGILLALTGAAAATYSLAHYSLGTIHRMGAGMVPTALGVLLTLFGIGIALSGWRRQGTEEVSPMKIFASVPVFIGAAILAFFVLIPRFGLIPAVFVTSMLASLAEGEIRLLRSLGVAVFLCVLTYILFVLGLRLTIPAFAWPAP